MKYFIALFFIFIGSFIVNGTPVITQVDFIPSTPTYQLMEINFDLNQYINPYDPLEIDVYGEFISPIGETIRVNAFYYEGFDKTDFKCENYYCETLTENNENNWKIRFTPNVPGKWKFKIYAYDGLLISEPDNNYYIFTSYNDNDPGFIIKANKRYLKRTTGDFFFPISQNLGWFTKDPDGLGEYGTNELKHYMDKMAANGINSTRLWLDTDWSLNIIGHDKMQDETFYEYFNQHDSWQLDWVFDYAKQKDINIQLCFFNQSNWGDGAGGWYARWTNTNPFNVVNGGTCNTPYDFFSNQDAIDLTKKMIRYIVARWGYSTNLLSWDLQNEFDQIAANNVDANPIPPPLDYTFRLINWHSEMYDYIKEIDPYNHLISTGTARSINSENKIVYAFMDFAQGHKYQDSTTPNNNTPLSVRNEAKNSFFELSNKPFIVGEHGLDHNGPEHSVLIDPHGFELHGALWVSAFSGAFGTSSAWWWEDYIDAQNLYPLFKPIDNFMSSLPILTDDFESQYQAYANTGNSSYNGLRTFCLCNSDLNTLYGWTQDYNFTYNSLRITPNGVNYLQTLDPSYKPDQHSSNNSIELTMIPNRTYKVEWYRSTSGLLYDESSIETDDMGILIINMPHFLRNSKFGDAVFKVSLDCDVNVWTEGTISNSTYENVWDDVVCNQSTGQIFYRTTDNKLHSMWWNGETETWDWTELDGVANNVAGDLAVSANGHVFYRTTENRINNIYYTSEDGWLRSDLNFASGNNVKGPIAVNSFGQVFYRTTDYKMNSIYYTSNDGWLWSELNNSASGNVGNSIAISSNNHVFYKTLDQKLNNIYYTSGGIGWQWSGLNNAADNVFGSLTITPNNQVFYKTVDGYVNNIYYTINNGWLRSELSNAGVNCSGDLVAMNDGKVFYRTFAGKINCIYWENNDWHWSGLNNSTWGNVVPGNLATFDTRSVFYRSSNNTIRRVYYKGQCDNSSSLHFKNYSIPEEKLKTDKMSLLDEENGKITIFPNPTSSNFKISSQIEIEKFSIYNSLGKLVVFSDKVMLHDVVVDLNMNNGLFVVQVTLVNGEVYVEKIIVNK